MLILKIGYVVGNPQLSGGPPHANLPHDFDKGSPAIFMLNKSLVRDIAFFLLDSL